VGGHSASIRSPCSKERGSIEASRASGKHSQSRPSLHARKSVALLKPNTSSPDGIDGIESPCSKERGSIEAPLASPAFNRIIGLHARKSVALLKQEWQSTRR